MAGSLRDQLVKAGLATAGQAKKAERQNRAEKQARRNDPAPDPQAAARQLKAEKAERDRALARVRNDKASAKALRAEIKQIILQNDQRASAVKDDDVPYNFVHGKKIKKIHLPRDQQRELSKGTLVIVNNDGRYHLVSRAVADQISSRDPKRIIADHTQSSSETSEDDEHYAKFKVPDDLDW
jgi:uncharacterized protein YaiL (DUF2058 family)